jgi:hypothetical protein
MINTVSLIPTSGPTPAASNVALVNELYRIKKQHCAEAERKRDWWQYILLHEKPYRLKRFARRFAMNEKSFVASGWVPKHDVLAYFASRTEREIVVMPDNVRDIVVKAL